MKIYLYSVADFDEETVCLLVENPRVLKLSSVGHLIMKSTTISDEEYENRLLEPIPDCITEFGFAESTPEHVWAALQRL